MKNIIKKIFLIIMILAPVALEAQSGEGLNSAGPTTGQPLLPAPGQLNLGNPPQPLTPLPIPSPPPSSLTPNPSAAPEKGAYNPKTGESYPGTFGGAINPRTGTFLPKVNGGYINPQNGEFYPEQK